MIAYDTLYARAKAHEKSKVDNKKGKIKWLPAKGKKLSDHEAGDLCRDSYGNVYLIGCVIEKDNYFDRCGCYSDDITTNDIVEYCEMVDKKLLEELRNS